MTAVDAPDDLHLTEAYLTPSDIATYIRYRLRRVYDFDTTELDRLAHNAQGSFVWAVTACRFLAGSQGTGTNLQSRLQLVLDEGEGLDPLYIIIMNSNDLRDLMRSEVLLPALGLILYTAPMTLQGLLDFASPAYFPPEIDAPALRSIFQHLAPVMDGVNATDSPIVPYHQSFFDFLNDSRRSGTFRVVTTELPKVLALCRAIKVTDSGSGHIPDTPSGLTDRDISLYVRHAVQRIRGLDPIDLQCLAQRARGSYVWAVIACRHVLADNGSDLDRVRRSHQTLSHGGSLDSLYSLLLAHDPWDTVRVQLLRVVLAASEPVSLLTLKTLIPQTYFPPHTDFSTLINAAHQLRFLFGDVDVNTPMDLHPTFKDFIRDIRRSHAFHIDSKILDDIHAVLAIGCFRNLSSCLCFSHSGFATSMMSPGDTFLVNSNSPVDLAYCCRAWPYHSSFAVQDPAVVAEMTKFLANCAQVWVDAMTWMQSSPESALKPLSEVRTKVSASRVSSVCGI